MFLICVFSIQAQKLKISEKISIRNDDGYEILGKINDMIYLYRDRPESYQIQTFDKNMNLKWTKELELEKRRVRILHLVNRQNRITLLYQYKNKGNTYIKLREYDPTLSLSSSDTIMVMEQRPFSPNWIVYPSQNKRVLAFENVEKSTRFEGFTFDLNTKKIIWEKTLTPSDYNRNINHHQTLVGDDGSLYIITDYDNRKLARKDTRFKIFKYHPKTEESIEQNIHLEEKLWFDAEFALDNLNGSLLAGGLYSERRTSESNGIFYLNAPVNNLEQYTLEFTAYDEELLKNLLGKEVQNPHTVKEVSIQDVILRRDGGILLVAELNKKFTRQNASRFNNAYRDYASFQVDYYYEDIMVISLHPNGQIHWNKVLHKYQYSQDDDAIFSSYFLLKTKSSLRFLYNDEIKSENNVNEYIVIGNGQYERQNLFSTAGEEIRLRLKDARQVAGNEIIIPSEYRLELRLVKLTY